VEPGPDRALVEAWRRGEQAAGRALFERYYEPVARFFFNKVGEEEARDLVQKTFVACLEGLAGFRGEGEFRSWLFGIAYRLLCRHYRGAAGERARAADFEQVSVVDLGTSPSRQAAAGEEIRLLLTALQRLPIDYQVVLELHYWEDMTTDEIAATIGLPPGTARSRLRRGRQLLEQELAAVAGASDVVETTLAGMQRWIAAIRAQTRAPE
jgi:RNA polymerase sigma-70 factor (ECF subfamily)